jgi:pimeloyl-ACP methyl ester carboxylesterase
VRGEGDPTLVLVHGWAMDHRLWDGQVPGLAAHHRVVTLDLAGHGESGVDRADWTMAAFGRDVHAVVQAIDAQQVILIGHSMSGPVVLEAARMLGQRVKGIVLVDTLLDVEYRTPPDEIASFAKQLEADYRNTTIQMANENLFAPATPEPVRELVLRHATALAPKRSIAMLCDTWGYDPLPALQEIEVPIRAVNDAAVIPGTGHYPMLEDPARFDPALDAAIAAIERAKG